MHQSRAPLRQGKARVPVIMQMEALECGAACLTMVMAYYGLWVPLEQVRQDCGVSRDGSSAKNILKAARSHGFTAKGYRYEVQTLRQKATFPCIIHWNFNHFVVLCGFKGNKVYINDPARGQITVNEEEFDAAFTGICLLLEPNETFQQGGKKPSITDFARQRLKGSAPAFALLIATTCISSLISILNPAFARIFMDRLLTGENPQWLYPFVAILLLLAAAQTTAAWIQCASLYKIQGKFAVVANSQYMWHVLRLPMEFFAQRQTGDIAGRQTENAGIASTLIMTLAPLVLDVGMLLFYLLIMFRYSLLLTAIGLVSLLLSAAATRYIAYKRINISRVQMRDQGKLQSVTLAGIDMIETIKASGAEQGFFQRWAGTQAAVNAGTVRFQSISAYLSLLPSLISSLSSLLILGIGVYITMQGSFTVGMILAFQGFMTSLSAPAQKLTQAAQSLQEMRTNMERVQDVMRYPADAVHGASDVSDAVSYDKLRGKVELRHITFGYSRLAEPLIQDFSLTLEPGKSVALVGGSGSGKSTISKLVAGLYQPWSGEILFDEIPRQAIQKEILTGSLAVVDQDIILFEDTIANNIKMWDTSIEDFEMIMAARDAQIHDTIMQREGGYRYRMLEGGRDFSGGQRQRMEIARVLAQDPTIVILDEATSALDAQTEYNVVQSIKNRGISMIVVAHRLSTVRDCDEIIVLDHGRVVERGTHVELLARNGLYTQLIRNE